MREEHADGPGTPLLNSFPTHIHCGSWLTISRVPLCGSLALPQHFLQHHSSLLCCKWEWCRIMWGGRWCRQEQAFTLGDGSPWKGTPASSSSGRTVLRYVPHCFSGGQQRDWTPLALITNVLLNTTFLASSPFLISLFSTLSHTLPEIRRKSYLYPKSSP